MNAGVYAQKKRAARRQARRTGQTMALVTEDGQLQVRTMVEAQTVWASLERANDLRGFEVLEAIVAPGTGRL